MFTENFYPTPDNVIEQMLVGYEVYGKTILEPSAGKGNIVDYLTREGATVIGCENHPELRKIVQTKCTLIGADFLEAESHQISHIDMIVMNPPFSHAAEHILHAYDIAPAGCDIIAICNKQTLKHGISETRIRLRSVIETNGSASDLDQCFKKSERYTDVEVSLIKLKKHGENYSQEFEGFFLDDEPEEAGENGIMPYNFIRDLVNRYVAAVKIYDEQLNAAVKMNNLTSGFYSSKMAFQCTEESKPKNRNEFKKDLQKSAWQFIFNKMNMQKYATQGLKEDINKFVEKQHHIPFTMANIYRMLEIVIGTQAGRMDKAMLEVFDKLTEHTKENRYGVEGFATNSHYLINKKFIMPWLCNQRSWNKDSDRIDTSSYGDDTISDFVKALCFLSGTDYDTIGSFYSGTRDHVYGEKFEWAFFNVRCFKKGTAHFEFMDPDLWAKFNQHIARIKGYPLHEKKEQTSWQKKQAQKQASFFA